jgi:predicted nuclease with RNAse H fold
VVLTVGVDLAAEPVNTAVAAVRWGSAAIVEGLRVGAGDDELVEAITAADKAGIDCPLGWPREFVAFMTDHQAFRAPTGYGADWRRALATRVTDREVRRRAKLVPLSVSTDRIGLAAMRCAGLLARLAEAGQPVDRTGTGVVVEVYPAASLKLWGLPHRGYKGPANAAVRGGLVDALLAAAPWLDLGPYEADCRRTDHALDAVVAALAARASALGAATTAGGHDAASTEGWIALPTGPLAGLV